MRLSLFQQENNFILIWNLTHETLTSFVVSDEISVCFHNKKYEIFIFNVLQVVMWGV